MKFLNGKFFVDGRFLAADVLVEDGVIVHAGDPSVEGEHPSTQDGCRAEEVVDLGGRFVLPGFEDAHNHPSRRSRTLSEIDLRRGDLDWEGVVSRLRDACEEGLSAWIVVHGWNDSKWGVEVTQALVDEVCGDRAVFFFHHTYHMGLVSSAGIAKLRSEGWKGEDEEGAVHEKNFVEVEVRTAPGVMETAENIKRYCDGWMEKGIVAVHDMYVTSFDQLEAYVRLLDDEEFVMNVSLFVDARLFEERGRFRAYVDRLKGQIQIRGVKVFMDGTIGTKTACFKEAYCCGMIGSTFVCEEEFRRIVDLMASFGLRDVAVHAIGDGGIEKVLDIVEAIGDERLRWRLEHCEMLVPEALVRMKKLGVVASVQPNFLWDAVHYGDRLGDRVKELVPLRSILDHDVLMPFGSDDMPSGPMDGIGWAVDEGQFPRRAVTFAEAVDAYTRVSAEVVEAGDRRGRIAEGCEASFVVYDEDVSGMMSAEMMKVLPREVWVRGRRVK